MSFRCELMKKLVVAAGIKKRWLSSTTEELLEKPEEAEREESCPGFEGQGF